MWAWNFLVEKHIFLKINWSSSIFKLAIYSELTSLNWTKHYSCIWVDVWVIQVELIAFFKKNVIWAHSSSDFWGECRRHSWILNIFPIKARCWDFIANLTLAYLPKLGLSTTERKKSIKRLKDWRKAVFLLIWHSHIVMEKQ